MKHDKKAIGRRIKSIRVDICNATMEEFANLIGSGKSNVSRWERGENIPNDLTLKKISELGNISFDELFYGDVERFAHSIFFDEFSKIIEELKQEKNFSHIDKYIGITEAGEVFDEWTITNLNQLDYDDENIIRSKVREINKRIINKNKKNDNKDEITTLNEIVTKIMDASRLLDLDYFVPKENENGKTELAMKEDYHDFIYENAKSIIDEAGARLVSVMNKLQEYKDSQKSN